MNEIEKLKQEIVECRNEIARTQKTALYNLDGWRKSDAQLERAKKYATLLLDICVVMGNDPYVIWAGLQNRVKTLWDIDEEERGYKMAEDILNKMLKISAIDWAEIAKWGEEK